MMRNGILNIFGIGKWPFSASLASLLVIPVYYFSSLYLFYALYVNVALFLLILLWSMVELHRNSC